VAELVDGVGQLAEERLHAFQDVVRVPGCWRLFPSREVSQGLERGGGLAAGVVKTSISPGPLGERRSAG